MPIEKDFSPTLAGDDRAQSSRRILDWLRRVPRLIREGGDGRVVVGLKLMNAMFDDAFQLDMIRAATEGDGTGNGADWLVVANRLFDPAKQFDGKTGVAYGGPELSKRNLRILRLAGEAERDGSLPPMPPISATGDILTGRMAAEYALAGAANFQMHTVFQLPNLSPGLGAGWTVMALSRTVWTCGVSENGNNNTDSLFLFTFLYEIKNFNILHTSPIYVKSLVWFP